MKTLLISFAYPFVTGMNAQHKTIKAAAEITDAAGKVYYEAEAGGKDYLFNVEGKPVKKIGE